MTVIYKTPQVRRAVRRAMGDDSQDCPGGNCLPPQYAADPSSMIDTGIYPAPPAGGDTYPQITSFDANGDPVVSQVAWGAGAEPSRRDFAAQWASAERAVAASDALDAPQPDVSAGQPISRVTTSPQPTPRLPPSGSASDGGGGFNFFSWLFKDTGGGDSSSFFANAYQAGKRSVGTPATGPGYSATMSQIQSQGSQVMSAIRGSGSPSRSGFSMDAQLFQIKPAKIDYAASYAGGSAKAGGSRILLLAALAVAAAVGWKEIEKINKKRKGA